MGDSICVQCPKWDAAAGRVKPTLGAYDQALIELAVRCIRYRCLPEPGGLLDQDPILMGLLDEVFASGWVGRE